jgi:hypothetical protein
MAGKGKGVGKLKEFWVNSKKVFFSDQFGLFIAGWLLGHAYHNFRQGEIWFGLINWLLSAVIGVLAWRALERAMRKAARQ